MSTALGEEIERSYWLYGTAERVATGLTGLIAVLIAVRSAAWAPGLESFPLQNEIMRLSAFGSLTVWATLTMGLSRRGAAAMLTMAFATFLDLLILPVSGETLRTLSAGASGIVLAFLGLQFYWYRVSAGQRNLP
ncbi:MAG: hypothetical protein MRY64_00485 [Hyphomonadaceae bacterium]|nr:hypothetical protein [Hyphomonadaceae bacterium]